MIPVHFLVGEHEIGIVQRRSGIAVFVHGIAPGYVHLIPVAAAFYNVPAVVFAAFSCAQGKGAGDTQLMHEILKALDISGAGGPVLGHQADHALILHVQHIVGVLDQIAVHAQNLLIIASRSGDGLEAGGGKGVYLGNQPVDFLHAQGIGEGNAGAVTQQGCGGGGIGALAVKPEILRMIRPQGR